MKRIILTTVFGVSLVSLSFGKNLANDTTAVVDSTKKSAVVDSATSVAKADSLKAGRDTSIVKIAPGVTPADSMAAKAAENTVVPHDSTAIQTPIKKSAEGDIKGALTKGGSADPNGYKDVRWGMTSRDVKDFLVDNGSVDEYSIEPITNGFEYPGTVAGTKATIAYQFDNERLYIVRLTPQVKAKSKFDFLDTFEEYQTTLEAKYGRPTRTGFRKLDEQYLNTIESIQLGFAKKYALWEFDRSYVVLVLAGKNKRLEIHITYLSRAIFEEMKDRIETLKLEDF